MSELISRFQLGDMSIQYILNDPGCAVLMMLPQEQLTDLFSAKSAENYGVSSLVHLKLEHHEAGMFSNSFKLSDSMFSLKYKQQNVTEEEGVTTIITEEEAEEGYGIRHKLVWREGEKGVEISNEFYNHSGRPLELEYITSASLDALSPYLDDEGSRYMVFHRFKAGWSMEGLHQQNNLMELGLEKPWAVSGECLTYGAVGSRPVREYHPYGAIEDTKNHVTWGMYLAHNASWQMELSRVKETISLSMGLADCDRGKWTKVVGDGECFCTPVAYVSVCSGGIADVSNRLLSMRHRAIDAYGEVGLPIIYNDFVTTWGYPSESGMLAMADVLKKGKTKYLVMDAGWNGRKLPIKDWTYEPDLFPNGLKLYCDKVREKGFVPGVWMEFECADAKCMCFGKHLDHLKLKKNGKVIVGHVINGRREQFFDFRLDETIEYMQKNVIDFLKENGFGYIKIDYNTSPGIGVDGDESPGENLRQHMEQVRNFFIRIKEQIPDLIIENCASGGCRLEPSMMDITAMSSASDTHEGFETALIGANLHYLTPPRQNQLWCTLKPEYSKERFAYIIAQGFLGRLCWSGLLRDLSEQQLEEMFRGEDLYEEVSPIIARGNSFVYRTQPVSFHRPVGTQAVVRYSEDGTQALVVAHSFNDRESLSVELNGTFRLKKTLYDGGMTLDGNWMTIDPHADLCGNVYWLERV